MANYPELVQSNVSFDVYKVNVPNFMLCAFINDDETGLTSTGKNELEEFKHFLDEEFVTMNWNIVSCEDNSFMSQFNGMLTAMTEAYVHVYKN